MSAWGKGRGGRPWRRLRAAVALRDKYICQICSRLVDNGECDHIVPESRGGKAEMGNLQWLCPTCHAAKTAREGGPASNHPAWLPKPACRTVLVTGPAGAGKSTYCQNHAGAGDEVIDLDQCFLEVCGIHGHRAPREYLDAAIRLRNHKLAGLSRKTGGTAYFICSCPTDTEVAWWLGKLGAEHVRVDPGYSVSMMQVSPERRHITEAWYRASGTSRIIRESREQRRERAGDHWGR